MTLDRARGALSAILWPPMIGVPQVVFTQSLRRQHKIDAYEGIPVPDPHVSYFRNTCSVAHPKESIAILATEQRYVGRIKKKISQQSE